MQNFSIISICKSTENKTEYKVDIFFVVFVVVVVVVVFELFAQNIRFVINLSIYRNVGFWSAIVLVRDIHTTYII